jgi:hypothetical protein
MEKVIEKIHTEFKSCADKTLKESNKFLKKYKPVETKQSADVDFLKSIGFGGVDFVREQDKFNADAVEKNFQDSLKLENEKALAERITELKKLYPEYSVVTEDTVKAICNKYGLVFASSKFYTGTIPNKNIADLMKFTKDVVIDDKNKLFLYWGCEESWWLDRRFDRAAINKIVNNNLRLYTSVSRSADNDYDVLYTIDIPKYCDVEIYRNSLKAEEIRKENYYNKRYYNEDNTDDYKFYCKYRDYGDVTELNNFFITAPPKDFDFKDFDKSSAMQGVNKVVYAKNNDILTQANGVRSIQLINDPVILKHVMGYNYKSAKSSKDSVKNEIKPLFLLVTLWGIEKYDPLLNNTDPIHYN